MAKKPTTPRGIEARPRRGRDGSSTWTYRVRWIDPASGRRMSEERDTIDEALDFQAHLRLARRRGALEDITRGEVLLRAFVETAWWPNDAGRNLERSTLSTYAPVWNRHLNPRIGHLQLRQVTPPVVQQLREDLEHDGVGAPTVRRAMAILQAICRYAIIKGHLTTNPVKEVSKPRVVRQRAIVALSPREVELLRDELDDTGRMLVSLIAYQGLRPEEALALEAAHIRASTLLIERRLIDGELVLGIKGRSGARSGRSPELFTPVRSDLRTYRLATGRVGGLVFARPDGTPWKDHDYRNWRRRVFKPAVARAGLGITRPYDLRHACASLLLHSGMSLPEVAGFMGHSVGVLSDVYSHIINDLRGQPAAPAPEQINAAREGRAETKEAADG